MRHGTHHFVRKVCRLALCCLAMSSLWAATSPDNALNISWGDQIVVGKGADRLDTPERIRESLSHWRASYGITTVYWRMSSWIIGQYHERRVKGAEWYYDRVREAEKAGDPRDHAIRACRDLGLRIYAYLTIYDEGAPASVLYGDNSPFPWQSRFTIEHPEFLVCNRERTKRHAGVMEYWYPEVRQYKIGQIRDLLDRYDFDGVYVCTRSHSPVAEAADMYGFNTPVVEAFRQRHGVDVLTQDFDVQAWRDLRGEGLTLLLRELRGELSKRSKRLAVGIPRTAIIGPPYGNMSLRWRDWVGEHLVDEIVLGVQSGNFHYPCQKGRDRERGYLASGDEGFGLAPLAEDVRERYGPACRQAGVTLRLSSSTVFPVLPELAGNMMSAGSLGVGSAHVMVAPHESLDLVGQGRAVDFWVFPESTKDYPRLLCKYNHVLGADGRGWEIMIGEEARLVFRASAEGNDVHVRSREPLQTRTWTHVVCGYEKPGAPFRIYLNGRASLSTEVAAFVPRRVPVPLCIGRYAGGGRQFKGRIARVRIWDRFVEPGADGVVRPPEAGLRPVVALDFGEKGEKATVAVVGPSIYAAVMGDAAARCVSGPHGDHDAILLGPR